MLLHVCCLVCITGYCLYATLFSCHFGLEDSAIGFYCCIFFPTVAMGFIVPIAFASVTPAPAQEDSAADEEQAVLTGAGADESATAAEAGTK